MSREGCYLGQGLASNDRPLLSASSDRGVAFTPVSKNGLDSVVVDRRILGLRWDVADPERGASGLPQWLISMACVVSSAGEPHERVGSPAHEMRVALLARPPAARLPRSMRMTWPASASPPKAGVEM